MEEWVEVRWVLSVVRRWLWLIVVCTLLAAISAFLVSSWLPPVYSSSATLLVHQIPTAGMSDYNAVLTSERLARTYSKMLSGQPVLETVIGRLELEETPDDLAKRVQVELVPDTQLIRLSVEDTDPAWAALIANTLAEAFITRNEALQEARYADSLAGLQERIASVAALVDETQAEIDGLGEPTTDQEEAELTRLESTLAGHRSTYLALQQDYERMRLTAVQSARNVILAETAQAPERPIQHRTLYTALAAAVGAMLAVGVAFLVVAMISSARDLFRAWWAMAICSSGVVSLLVVDGSR